MNGWFCLNVAESYGPTDQLVSRCPTPTLICGQHQNRRRPRKKRHADADRAGRSRTHRTRTHTHTTSRTLVHAHAHPHARTHAHTRTRALCRNTVVISDSRKLQKTCRCRAWETAEGTVPDPLVNGSACFVRRWLYFGVSPDQNDANADGCCTTAQTMPPTKRPKNRCTVIVVDGKDRVWTPGRPELSLKNGSTRNRCREKALKQRRKETPLGIR